MRRVGGELQVHEVAFKDKADVDVSGPEIDAMAQSDPIVQQAILPVLTQIQKQLLEAETGLATPDAKAVEKLARGLAVVEERLEARRQSLKQKLAQQKRAAVEAEVKQLKTHARVLEEMIAKATTEVDRSTKEAVSLRRTSVDLDMARAQVELLEQVVRVIGMEREKLQIELRVGGP
jgi:hypothetical protein